MNTLFQILLLTGLLLLVAAFAAAAWYSIRLLREVFLDYQAWGPTRTPLEDEEDEYNVVDLLESVLDHVVKTLEGKVPADDFDIDDIDIQFKIIDSLKEKMQVALDASDGAACNITGSPIETKWVLANKETWASMVVKAMEDWHRNHCDKDEE